MKPFQIKPAARAVISAFCTLILGVSLASVAHADTLIENVEGLTFNDDGELERFNLLWIDDEGRVKGTYPRNERPQVEGATRIDGQGRTMLPGFIDSHLHVMKLGFAQLTLDLSDTNSLAEALEKIAQFARENPNRPWILGGGWNQEKWGLGRFPTAAELDSVVADRPVYLGRVDGHAGWANTKALELAGVSASSQSPAGGRIERLPDGSPSGVFIDAAESLMQSAIPAPRPVERDLALRETQALLLSLGVTAVADMGTSIEEWQTLRRAGDVGRLTIRVMAYADSVETMELIGGTGPSPWLYGDRLRLNGVKIYLDGAMGSRGAWMKEPYSDAPGERGLTLTDPTRMRNLLSRAALGNFQAAIHAIGDAANAEVINAIADLSETYHGDRRWRIEHAQRIDPADIATLGQNQIIASMQPRHQTSDRLMAEARLGSARLDGAYAWRSVDQAGGILAFGSDAPVEPANALEAMAVAISRIDASGEPFGGWQPQETVSRETALAAYTRNGAYAGFADGRFGQLTEGQWADFVLIDVDPTLASADELRQARVLSTWIEGKEVYRAEN